MVDPVDITLARDIGYGTEKVQNSDNTDSQEY